MKQRYSVLMSVYSKDSAAYLTESMESMIRQSVPCDQFVIVEDGAVGAELEDVIRGYERAYPEIFTVVPLAENGGLGRALNAGIQACKYDLIARMDADDISKPDRCQKQLEAFEADPELEILGTQVEEFTGSINHIISRRIVPADGDGIRKFARRRSPFNHPTVMYRKSTLEQLGGYREYGRKEDLDLFLRAAFSGIGVGNLDEPLLYYRTSPENQKRRKSWTNCREYIQIMYGFFRQKKIGFVDMLYVLIGQITLYVMPEKFTSLISKRFLRS